MDKAIKRGRQKRKHRIQNRALQSETKVLQEEDSQEKVLMSGTIRVQGRESCEKEADNLKDWSDLPLDIVRLVVERLRLIDRIRIRAVCKAWSVVRTQNIPTIHKFPWAMTFNWLPIPAGTIHGECLLIDPPVCRTYIVKPGLGEKERCVLQPATPLASSYGWVLLLDSDFQFILYSPFTSELINLPKTNERFYAATFSLNAISPRCLIFSLWVNENNLHLNLCSPGDNSWKPFKYSVDSNFGVAVHAAYGGGFFYCLFSEGGLGAFDIGRQEWTVLTWKAMIPGFDFLYAKLIVSIDSDGGIQVMAIAAANSSTKQLLKFNFSELQWVWVGENDLNNRVLLIGCTCFSCPAVGEARELANHVLSCPDIYHPDLGCHNGNGTSSDSQEYRSWLRTVLNSKLWIEFPLNGYGWRANDLIDAV